MVVDVNVEPLPDPHSTPLPRSITAEDCEIAAGVVGKAGEDEPCVADAEDGAQVDLQGEILW